MIRFVRMLPCMVVPWMLGACAAHSALPSRPAPGTAAGILLRAPGDDGVKAYRIPGLATTNKGTLLAVYDMRHKSAVDLPADIDIGLSRSTDGGDTWESMRTILDMGGHDAAEGVGDPAILVDRTTGTIWVAAVYAHRGRGVFASKPGLQMGRSSQLLVISSTDDGKTWSAPRNITHGAAPGKDWKVLFQGPGAGICTRAGALVFAAQYWDALGVPHATLLASHDHGLSWHCGVGAKPQTTEAQVLECDDGALMLNMRDNRGGSRSVAVTRDFGATWTEHPTSRKALPEPVCQASLLRVASVKDGAPESVVAFFNPHDAKDRRNLSIQLSRDEGMTWTSFQTVNPAPCFGYSCMTMVDPDTVGVLYEGRGSLIFEKIKWRSVPPAR